MEQIREDRAHPEPKHAVGLKVELREDSSRGQSILQASKYFRRTGYPP